MQFHQIIAQEEVEKQLRGLVQNNRLSHALMFLGREGCGALPLAIAFAQYILCEKVNQGGDAASATSLFGEEENLQSRPVLEDSCGVCASCVKVGRLIHPDLHFSYPALKRDARHERVLSTDYMPEWREFILQNPYLNVADWVNFLKENAKIDSPVNKQGNITVFECEDILHKLSLKSFEGRYKILIMWMPEFLGKEGNRLLKLIEEPPADTLFIFVAEDDSAVLPTILSRVQLVRIPSLAPEAVELALVEQYGASAVKAAQVAAISRGNFREAVQLLDHADEDHEETIRNWLHVIIRNDANEQLKWIDLTSRMGREKQKQLLRYFIHLVEQSIRVRFLSIAPTTSVPERELDFANRLNTMCGMEAQEAIARELDKAIYYVERNAHAKMLFHALTIRFLHIIKDNSLILVH